MRIYWYWPFAREEDIALALATPGPDDTLTVSALDRAGAPFLRTERVTALPELPEVREVNEGSVRWALSRARTYQARARVRSRCVATGGFDVCHVAFVNQYTDIVGLARIARRTNLVTTVHDVLPHRSRMPQVVQHQALAMLYRVAGTIVVHHEDVGAELMARFHVDPGRVHVVPHWVSPFRDVGDRRTLSDAYRVLFFGTLRGNKGVEVLLDAVERLGPESGVQFHIAGRGDDHLERAVVAAAERFPNLTAEVGWITPERKGELFCAADLAVLPYTSFSSTSGVLHDAFGNHLPAVATDVGALRAGIETTGAGWVVPPGSADALAAAIEGAFSDPEAWRRAADGAREVAIRQAPERVGAALREVYRRAVDAGR